MTISKYFQARLRNILSLYAYISLGGFHEGNREELLCSMHFICICVDPSGDNPPAGQPANQPRRNTAHIPPPKSLLAQEKSLLRLLLLQLGNFFLQRLVSSFQLSHLQLKLLQLVSQRGLLLSQGLLLPLQLVPLPTGMPVICTGLLCGILGGASMVLGPFCLCGVYQLA